MIPKFASEGRYSAGVAAVQRQDENGELVEKGVRLPLFHYSGKQICSISTWDGLVRNEIHRVKSLEDRKCRGWKVNERPKSVFWEEDNVDAMYGVGSVLGRALKTDWTLHASRPLHPCGQNGYNFVMLMKDEVF